jgi:hypothetical protein
MAGLAVAQERSRATNDRTTRSKTMSLLNGVEIPLFGVFPGELQVEGWCVRCAAMRRMKEPRQIGIKDDQPAIQGKCPTCDTYIFRPGRLPEKFDDRSPPFRGES